MSSAEVFLWPLAGMFAIASAGTLWQARNPAAEGAARAKVLHFNWELPRWRQMAHWDEYQAQRQDPQRIARSSRRRAFLFAAIALAILAYLLTRS